MIRHVGVIGLGTIGKPIAERVLAAGYPISVYDTRAEPVAELAAAGLRACASPAVWIADSGFATGHDHPAR